VAIVILKTRLSMCIILAVLLICLSAVSFNLAADETAVKIQTLRQMGKQLLEVGDEQYQRGMYDQAKETLRKAAGYKEYLSVSDADKLDLLLSKLSSQPSSPVQPPADQNTTADKTESVASEQAVLVQQAEMAAVEQQVQPKQSSVNPEYIEFVPVEANDIGRTPQPAMPVEQGEIRPEFLTPAPQEPDIKIEVYQPQQPEQVQSGVPAAAEKEKAKEDYIEVVKQKQRIQQSYTKAVVNEAVAKAKEYAGKEDFSMARDEISRASGVIEKNKLLLGDEDYAQYSATLQKLSDEIDARQTEIGRLKAEESQVEAKASQQKLRDQQTADRQKRIQNLMTHSREYQEQQRYEDALAQLDTLLAIDPTNREALRNKQMLEDIINLRRQLEVKKEMGREEQDLAYETQKAMIPHADLFTYPRNWQDIVAKRKPEMITGIPPADAAVYKQLETLVDLSALAPDMPFEEAIEVIKNAVDPPLKIVVRWKDLEENAYIERDTVIGMRGLVGIPLGKGLRELLDSVSGGVAKVDFAVEDGIVTIALVESLPTKLITRVYDITELVGAPANYRVQLGSSDPTTSAEIPETSSIVAEKAATIVQMIQETIAPMSWLVNGGEGAISLHGNGGIGNYRLVISQTPQIHEQIQKLLLEDLRESLGQQISIEARFLFVTENFLEDIGLGLNNLTIPKGKISDKLGPMFFDFGVSGAANPESTLVPGTLASGLLPPVGMGTTPYAVELGNLQWGNVLDELAMSFFLKATQMHRDAKMLTAPRVTVLNGEMAYIRVDKQEAYVSNYEFEDITAAGSEQPTRVIATATIDNTTATGGIHLNVLPTITADKKYIILQINTSYTKANLNDFSIPSTSVIEGGATEFPIKVPTLEVSEVQTRVSVPDGGTLLIGGQKLGGEINKEVGVPGVSKVPILGRLFSHRSKVKDQDVLLILVKPTIILQQEAEREYFAPLE
jgi:type II secretory pathway component GspD/PulD (secretin)/tetratricopeptide (TPR) repeat protein